ncbi:unnamed protein product [Ambrosiozyma monospora]|uniref:Unnamed protein product n=1 Tax=Ambrosiozyma monospora TaxID=43982 RepID=A0A9W6T6J3_AMBMO|nr:unnamed protein product [Ambrosiozyma monospora]
MGDKSKSESYVKGAVEKLLPMSKMYYTTEGDIKPLTENIKNLVLQMADTLANDGLRVLAFAKNTKSFDSEPSDLVFCGLMGMNDPPRPQVSKSISALMRGGVHVIMITGDSETTAINIAKKIGMPITDPDRCVMSGDKIDSICHC